ncbi:MAG: hypothetical protein AAFX81_06700 [Pseudomonadota bacterium]
MIDDPFILRAIERLLAVIVGGLAIVLGYRLFVAIPSAEATSSAELSLSKDRRLVLTRIGPGVFFALFGAAIVTASFYFGVSGSPAGGGAYSGLGGPAPEIAETSAAMSPAEVPIDLQEALATLRFLQGERTAPPPELDEDETDWRATRLLDAQLVILQAIWQPGWGDPVEFGHWVRETPPRSARPAFERALDVLEQGELP